MLALDNSNVWSENVTFTHSNPMPIPIPNPNPNLTPTLTRSPSRTPPTPRLTLRTKRHSSTAFTPRTVREDTEAEAICRHSKSSHTATVTLQPPHLHHLLSPPLPSPPLASPPPLPSPHLPSPPLTSPHLTSPHLPSPPRTSPHRPSSHLMPRQASCWALRPTASRA